MDKTSTAPVVKQERVKRSLEQHYSVPEVAALLGVDESTVWRQLKLYRETEGEHGIGPAFTLGHRLTRVPASGVNRYLEAHKT